VNHDPNCAVTRWGDIRSWCDCGQSEREALPWYGGNKIPDSYLAKFMPKQEHDDLPWDLQVFIDNLGIAKPPVPR
jgi:hypothetical protein